MTPDTPAPRTDAPVDPAIDPATPAPAGAGPSERSSRVPPAPGWTSATAGEPDRRRGGRTATIVAVALVGAVALGSGVTAVGTVVVDDLAAAVRDATGDDGRAESSSAAVDGAASGGDAADVSLLGDPGADWSAVAAAVTPSTVSIAVAAGGPLGSGGGEGTGVVLDREGHVLTNNHVVASAARGGEIRVTLADGRVLDAEIAGLDPATDLAVLRLVAAPDDLTPATLGSSADVRVGQPVMAIGNPLGLSGTVTTGIVSAVDRPVTTGDGQGTRVVTAAVQTDAAVNPGNSGGPLVDAAGRVVGINSAIATLGGGGQQSGSIGLGFAIPVDEASRVADELVADGTADHARLGVEAEDGVVEVGDDRRTAAVLTSVVDGTPADEAGLAAGDAILAVDGHETRDLLSLTAIVRSYGPGETVELAVAGGGGEETVTATLVAADERTA